MKSLQDRIKYREQQRANEERERNETGVYAEGEESEGSGEFDPSDWVNDSVTNIAAEIGTLSDDEINQVEAAEKAGKGRAGVYDAIKNERQKRASNAGGWNANAT